MTRLAWTTSALAAFAAFTAVADDTGIAFPEGYRSWHHHRSTVNMTGHLP